MSTIISSLQEIASCQGIAMLEMSSGKRLFGFPEGGLEVDSETVALYDAGPSSDGTEKITVRLASVDAVYWVDHSKVVESWSQKKCPVHGERTSTSGSDCTCALRKGLFGIG